MFQMSHPFKTILGWPSIKQFQIGFLTSRTSTRTATSLQKIASPTAPPSCTPSTSLSTGPTSWRSSACPERGATVCRTGSGPRTDSSSRNLFRNVSIRRIASPIRLFRSIRRATTGSLRSDHSGTRTEKWSSTPARVQVGCFTMRLCHLQIAWLVPDDSLLRFSQLKISFISQNKTSCIRDRCCHLT